jgi:excisionase family DNA binding protein
MDDRRYNSKTDRTERCKSPVQQKTDRTEGNYPHQQMNNTRRTATLPILMTPNEVADLLRTSRAAIYAMNERGRLPGATRIGTRLLFRRNDLIEWLDQNRVPSTS